MCTAGPRTRVSLVAARGSGVRICTSTPPCRPSHSSCADSYLHRFVPLLEAFLADGIGTAADPIERCVALLLDVNVHRAQRDDAAVLRHGSLQVLLEGRPCDD